MAEKKPQTFENHAKIVPPYHFVALGLLFVNLLYAGWQLISAPSAGSGVGLLLAVALILVALYVRLFPLKVQDRLIRLEETLRMRDLLPAELSNRAGEIRPGQFVALRFAPDDELESLVRQVLDGKLKTAGEIKKAIKSWRPDYVRM